MLPGQRLGRTLGFPTANIQADPSCRLRHGIYAVRASVEGRTYDAVASWGRRPTVDDGAPLLETFLFDFTGDLYGKTMAVAFVAWLRARGAVRLAGGADDADAARRGERQGPRWPKAARAEAALIQAALAKTARAKAALIEVAAPKPGLSP